MLRNKLKCALVLTTSVMVGVSASALPTIGVKKKQLLKTSAERCDPAQSTTELDINNVRARVMTGGDMWWNQGTQGAAYEVPKGSKRNALYAGSVWVGGFTADKQLKVCAQTYRSDGNDYWPGPLVKSEGGGMTVDKSVCSDWDKFWKVDRVTINKFREFVRNGNVAATQNAEFQSIWEWPAYGNGIGSNMNARVYGGAVGRSGLPLNMDDAHATIGYAPFVNNPNDPGNNLEIYEPERGDFPGDPAIGDLLGDQYIWWVFNDVGNTKGQTKTEAIGMEVQTGAFAFASKDFMNDATFYNYRLINWGTSNLDSTFMGTWTDADLGYAFDDYIGCDTVRGLGILYNGLGTDGAGEANSYGTDIPMIGVDFFRGPHRYYTDSAGKLKDSVLKMTAFTYFNNGTDQRIGDPRNGVEVYNYMTGTSRNGQNFNNDFQGPGVSSTALGPGPDTRFVFFGDPTGSDQWSECVCQNPPFDRRFIHSAGPFVLYPGNINDITIGAVWVSDVGGCPNTSFNKIRLADDKAQELFDNGFKAIEGPQAPLLVKREMDKKIIFYLSNPPSSTNFQEKFGYEKDSSKYRVRSLKAVNAGSPDSLYQFEGYIVYQLKSNQVSISQIFNERGVLDKEMAQPVFQCDIRNGITQVVNWQKDISVLSCTDTCYYAAEKVLGRDSGITHSFEVTQDLFATGNSKNLVNYKTYYYVAIAYAYNNFAYFDPNHAESTQDILYLESSKGPGGGPIEVVEAMPNPFSHNVGTQFNADYGDGVIIKRMEGTGNGGNALDFTEESRNEALSAATGYQSAQPTYLPGRGPVKIKVVDPMKVSPGTWNLYIKPDLSKPGPYIKGPSNNDPIRNLYGDKAQWVLTNGDETIISERNIDILNEQILADYGLSLSVKQEALPGENQVEGNGYITSEIIFANPTLTWLGGVNDGEQTSSQNWIRSGNYDYYNSQVPDPPCLYSDNNRYDTVGQFYETLFGDYTFTRATWAPYSLGATETKPGCYFGVTPGSLTQQGLANLYSIDLVFTPDTSKWTKALVLETNNDLLSENSVEKFFIRSHQSWNKEMDAQGNPVYSTTPNDTGFSYFPGYAINLETGQRLNIVFGEDSYLGNHNGKDMLWNPTNVVVDEMGNSVWGGRHYVYISNTPYDGGDTLFKMHAGVFSRLNSFKTFSWMGIPTINQGFALTSLRDGLIPTETTLKFRVTRPYGRYVPSGVDTNTAASNKGLPWYQFSTDALAKKDLSEAGNVYQNDKQALLDKMHVVPNPYYARSETYEANRIDTRVRIIGLPQRATISIYSLDGSLIRRLDKDNNVSFIDWDIRNAKGLPIASGMYLVHVNAEGVGEKIIRWFGAMRPIDITQY